MKILKIISKKILSYLFGRGAYVIINNSIILAKRYGQYQSANKFSSLNANGLPTPWYTYPAIEFLENLEFQGLKVLEYGSGNSSLYYLRRGAYVIAIENDRKWYKDLNNKAINKDFDYIFTSSIDEYVKRPEITFADVIIIDGSYRLECSDYIAENISARHSEPYIVIFDNSDWYPDAIKKMDEKVGWMRVDFCGFGPINSYTWVTSVYFNPNKKIPRDSKHIQSIASIHTQG